MAAVLYGNQPNAIFSPLLNNVANQYFMHDSNECLFRYDTNSVGKRKIKVWMEKCAEMAVSKSDLTLKGITPEQWPNIQRHTDC